MRPSKIQITCVFAKSDQNRHWTYFGKSRKQRFFYANNEDSDQTTWMRRFIGVFVGLTCQKVQFLTLRRNWSGLIFKKGVIFGLCIVSAYTCIYVYKSGCGHLLFQAAVGICY